MDIAGCICGDPDAWNGFVETNAPIIYNVVRRTIARHSSDFSEADVHDTTQEVFLRLLSDDFRLLRKYDSKRADLGRWLSVIARNVSIDNLRRKRNFAPLGAAQYQAAAPVKEAVDPIMIPWELFSPRQREVVHMFFEKNMRVSEIAATLGIDHQTVRSTRHSALVLLRQYFGNKSSL